MNFKSFINESSKLPELVKEYIATVDVADAFGIGTLDEICTEPGNCAMVSEHLCSWLKDRGVAAKPITGYYAVNQSWAVNAGVKPGSDEDAHTVVASGNAVIDLTARQFDDKQPFPKITTIDQFRREWREISPGTGRILESVQETFYKAIPVASLSKSEVIPGTVTTDYKEALQWYERYNSAKKNPKGPAKHIERQPACIIKFKYDTSKLLSSEEFQRAGVREHDRRSSWTSLAKEKAQINEPIKHYEIALEAPKQSW